MSKSININIESNSMIGEYRRKVLSEMERLDKNLINLAGLYGFEASCLSAWKQTFLDTLWSIFSAMLPVKLREKECLLIQPCALLSEQRCSFLPGESFIYPASAIRVNTVSPLYRRPTSPLKKRPGKHVPFLRLSGEWLLDYGFEIGKKYETYAKKNQLILKIGGCSGSGSGGGISSDNDNDNDNDNTDRNRNVPDGDGIGGKNG
jgi:hypothetical protein